MPNPASCLPDAWVEKIWSTMRATYGAAFDRQWECPAGVDPVAHVRDLKGHWARELGGYINAPQAFRYGLENLPAHAPNLVEFKAICKRAPALTLPALEAPAPDAAGAAKVREAIQPLKSGIDPRAWIKALQKREAGQNEHTPSRVRLTQFQREAWREGARAIGLEVEA